MSTLYRATVTRIDSEGVFVEASELGEGGEWGPLELLAIPLEVGDPVLVGSINEIPEDLALLGKLVLNNPDPLYGSSSLIYAFENDAARTAASLTLVSGLATWLDDEQRLDVYTDELTAGWVSFYGVKASKLLYPSGLQIGVGVTSPTGSVSIATAGATDRAIDLKATADSVPRLQVNASGLFEWSDGTAAVDASLQRSASGTAGLLITPRVGVGGSVSSSATVTARQNTNRIGFFSNNTETAVTHGLAHFYAIEAGNDDSSFLGSYKSGETQPRFYQKINGEMRWGPGASTATDVNLYRSGVGNLNTSGSFGAAGDLYATFDIQAGDDLTVGDEAYVGNAMFIGPDQFDHGRGPLPGESLNTQGGTIGGTETIVITGQSQTYRAGRAYRVFIEGKLRYVTATSRPVLRVRKATVSGAVLFNFGEYPVTTASATNVEYPVCYFGTFTVASDITTALMLTLQCSTGSAAFTGVGGPSRGMFPVDVGVAIDYVNAGQGLAVLS